MDSRQKGAALLEAISEKAKENWGDDWKTQIVRAYCRIESQESGRTIKPVARRPSIMRALETGEGAATLETTIRLAEAVGLAIGAETLIKLY